MALKYNGIYFLYEAVDPGANQMSLRPWKSNRAICLSRNIAWELTQVYLWLVHNGIILSKDQEKLMWKMNKECRMVTVKLYYWVMVNQEVDLNPFEWCKVVWKWHFPLNIHLFISMALNNRILMQDNIQRKEWEGPTRCPLYCDYQY